MTSGTKLEVLLDGLKFGEGPRWRDGKLWFADFYAHRVATVDLDGRDATIVEVPQRPSGLGWTLQGELLVVSMLDRRVLRFDGKALHIYADLAALATGLCNDMVVDAAGRAYVGNFGYDRHNDAPPRNTRIIKLGPRIATSLDRPPNDVLASSSRSDLAPSSRRLEDHRGHSESAKGGKHLLRWRSDSTHRDRAERTPLLVNCGR